MARRKGKSRRRMKGWERRLRERPDPHALDEAHESETLQKPRVKLPAFRLRPGPDKAELAGGERTEGMVTGLFPGGAYVRSRGRELLCRVPGTFRAPEGATALAVGDEVTVALTPAQQVSGDLRLDKVRADGAILSRRPRRSVLSRPQPTSGKRRDRYDETYGQVIVANMEILLVVVSTRQPAVRVGLIDRFSIVAERGEMRPLIVFNKIDLAPPEEDLLAELAAGGAQVLLCSALERTGLEDLSSALAGHTGVLAGASGVGKSSLVNALVPGADVFTRPIRMKDQRGRHATAVARVYDLPGGGLIVDTPGVRELALDMDQTELAWYFPEIAALAGACRFNNCTHTHEPDCAVRAAVEADKIAPRRYEGYLRIMETL